MVYFVLISRTGELLNLRSEKIDVLVVNKAIQESLEGWDGATLVEWTCAESPLLYEDKGYSILLFCVTFLSFILPHQQHKLGIKKKNLFCGLLIFCGLNFF